MSSRTTLTVDIGSDLHTRLRSYCEELGVSITDLVEKAIRDSLYTPKYGRLLDEMDELFVASELRRRELLRKKKTGWIKKTWVLDIFEMDKDEVAQVIGVSPRAVGNWACPRNKNGTYSLPDVVQWWCQRLEKPPRAKR